jgi:5-methylcytosine-specific restriction protein A
VKLLAAIRGDQTVLPFESRWSVGNRVSIKIGTPFFLYRQHSEQGIIARGITISDVFEDEHWGETRKLAKYVKIRFLEFFATEDRIPTADLIQLFPTIYWKRLQSSGSSVKGHHIMDSKYSSLTEFENQWFGGSIELNSVYEYPEETLTREFIEGQVVSILVSKYERSRAARFECLRHFGYKCTVCDVTMEERFGPELADYIHVHHLIPLNQIGHSYKLNPLTDLRPVCPNCHAAIHAGGRHRTIEEARLLISKSQQASPS